MVRILQLISGDSDYQARTTAQQLSRELGGDFAVNTSVVGHAYANRFAAVCRLRRSDAPEHDVMHAFGRAALSAAAIAGGSPIVYSPIDAPGRRDIRWLRAVMQHRDVQVVCPTDTIRRIFVERGVPIERCHLIRPGVSFASIKPRRNEALRRELGFGLDDIVLFAPGEATREAAQHIAVWTAAVLHVLDERYRLLLWGRGPRAAAVERFIRRLGHPAMSRIAGERLGRDVPHEQLLSIADIILITAAGPVATLPISQSMAAGLPIVASVSPTIAELLEDRHTALFTPRNTPRQLARRVLDLQDDARLQWAICDMARTEAYEYFSLTRMLNQYRAVLRQIAQGEPVEVPQQAPGAGLRFHGRA